MRRATRRTFRGEVDSGLEQPSERLNRILQAIRDEGISDQERDELLESLTTYGGTTNVVRTGLRETNKERKQFYKRLKRLLEDAEAVRDGVIQVVREERTAPDEIIMDKELLLTMPEAQDAYIEGLRYLVGCVLPLSIESWEWVLRHRLPLTDDATGRPRRGPAIFRLNRAVGLTAGDIGFLRTVYEEEEARLARAGGLAWPSVIALSDGYARAKSSVLKAAKDAVAQALSEYLDKTKLPVLSREERAARQRAAAARRKSKATS